MESSELSYEHHPSLVRYVIVWLALLVLTTLTWRLAYGDHGTAGLVIGMLIATTKATLVALFFMHLWDQSGVNRLVFVVALVYAGILMGLTVTDVATRFTPAVARGPTLPVPKR